MNTINSLVIEGNIVRDSEQKETNTGKQLCTFSIAANRSLKTANGEETKEVSYFDVETWGKVAEACGKQGTKGRGVRVIGRLKQNRWAGSDGKNYSRVTIIAEHVEFKPVFNNEKKTESVEVPTSEAVLNEVPVF